MTPRATTTISPARATVRAAQGECVGAPQVAHMACRFAKATTVIEGHSAPLSKGLQSTYQSGCTVQKAVSLLDVGWEVLQWF